MKKYEVLTDLFWAFEYGDIIECDEYMIDGDFLYKKYITENDEIKCMPVLKGKLVENHPRWFKKME